MQYVQIQGAHELLITHFLCTLGTNHELRRHFFAINDPPKYLLTYSRVK